jgi:ribosomal 50S subunit-recycling heat shock protein
MLNGEKRTITGEMGTSAEIIVNSAEANLQTEINPGDNINLKHAVDGKDAVLTIKDIIEYYNLQDVNIEVNGKIISSDYIICEDDKIAIEYPVKQQTKDVKTEKKMDFSDEAAAEGADNVHPGDEITVIVNKKEVKIKKEGPNSIFVDVFKYIDFDTSVSAWKNVILKLNGSSAAYTDTIKDGDVIEISIDNR